VLHKAGYNVPGQTEFYGQKAGVAEPLMILLAGDIRVALATIHIPLHRVSEQITEYLLLHRLRQLHYSLQNDFGCTLPRIAVLGVNPHAGEQGAIGTEEQTILQPALAQAQSEGIRAEGAFPADGFFAKKQYQKFDGILAMYHDQGLIPIKMLAEGHGVNFTAGLPFVRTSPDHGTAFDIAGTQSADPSAVVQAIHAAESIAHARTQFHIYS
jgi:4-hydroxythreonine-4-phosphate dehydrogenase